MGKCIMSILQLDVEKSDSILQNIDDIYDRAYLQHYQLFIDYMVLGNANPDYSSQSDHIIEILTNKKDNNVTIISYLSEIYIQKGIIDYANKKNLQAVHSFFKAHSYWQEASKHQNNLKLSGIFHLLLANIPKPYNKPAEYLGYKGDAIAGLKALKEYDRICNAKIGFREEALLYLGFAYLKFGTNKNEIKEYILQHSKITPNSPLCQSILIRCAFKIKSPELCQNWLNSDTPCHYAPLIYLKGKYAALQEDQSVTKHMNIFFANTKNNHFVADAHKYLSWYFLTNKDTLSFFKHQSFIRKLKDYPTWADQQAYQECLTNYIPNHLLLKARMLFDLNKINKALNLLINNKDDIVKTQKYKAEYYYRIARCYHTLNKGELAKKYYILTLNNSSETTYSSTVLKPNAQKYLKELNSQFH
jgi:hypothetical protein